jgi:hypothetical protein
MAVTLSYDDIAGQAASWNRTLADAEKLRNAIQSLPLPRAKPSSDIESTLFAIRTAYQKPKGAASRLLGMMADSNRASIIGPFIGDPALGEWPFHRPLSISDEDAVAWLEALAKYSAVDDPLILRFVKVSFNCRRREIWVPAADCYAHFALSNMNLLDEMRSEWIACFASDSGSSTDNSAKKANYPSLTHRCRHICYAVCAWIAAGGDPSQISPDLSAAKLSREPLPRDDADASAILLSISALLRSSITRHLVIDNIPDRAKEAPAEPQSEEVLRTMADELRMDLSCINIHEAICNRLIEPRWKALRKMQRLDGLCSWLESAKWFHNHNNYDALRQMIAEAPEAEAAIMLHTEKRLPPGATSAPSAVIDRLRTVLNSDAREIVGHEVWTIQLAELLALFTLDSVRALPWEGLVRQARQELPPRGQGEESTHSVADIACIAIVESIIQGENEGAKTLLYGKKLPQDILLNIVNSPNGFIQTQAALNLERILRGMQTPAEQVRIIWAVLQRNPKTRFFDELLLLLPGEPGESTALRDLIEVIRSLDMLRDDDPEEQSDIPARSLAACYRSLADHVERLFADAVLEKVEKNAEYNDNPATILRANAAAFLSIEPWTNRNLDDADSSDWKKALRDVLVGTDTYNGLDDWMDWLKLNKGANKLRIAHGQVEEAIDKILDEQIMASDADCDILDKALSELTTILEDVPWPEAHLLRKTIANIATWNQHKRNTSRKVREHANKIKQALDSGDEGSVIDLARAENTLLLCRSDLRALWRFFAGRFLFSHIRHLNKRLRSQNKNGVMPSVFGYLSPLFTGVAAGCILVLDVGTDWNNLVTAETAWRAFGTGVVSLALAFIMLAGECATHLRQIQGGLRRAAKAALRVLPVYSAAVAVAALCASVVLFSLREDTGEWSWSYLRIFLWTGLSSFLGLFIGVLLQGRRLTQLDD